MVSSLKGERGQIDLRREADGARVTRPLLVKEMCCFVVVAVLLTFCGFPDLIPISPASAGSSIDQSACVDVSGGLCTVLQTSLGDGPHETQASAKMRFRMDVHLIPQQLDFVVRFQNAAGEYFLGPGQVYPVNNISIDKPSDGFMPKGNALVDYAYVLWRPSHVLEFALGVFEPWTFDMGTRDGLASFLNGISDCGGYLHNLHFFSLAGFKPAVINFFRSLPAFALRYDPSENWRFRGFAMTTQVEKWGLFNPEWELSKHLPDYTSYFFELEHRGQVFGKMSSYRIDVGWVDALHVAGLRDPEKFGFSWGIVISHRVLSDHFSVNGYYYYSDDTLANRLVNFIQKEGALILTLAWGGSHSTESPFYNYLCKHLVHIGVSKSHAYDDSFIPIDFRRLKAMTPVIRDEYAFELLYNHRMGKGFSWNVGVQVIKNPAAGHEEWMFVPEWGLSVNF